MTQSSKFNLEERTFQFAKNVRNFIRGLKKEFMNYNDCQQLLRSSGSVGANYIEANESLSKKDFILRIKICLKEAKESFYWLKLIEINDKNFEKIKFKLIDESIELKKIFSTIIVKSK